MNTAATHFECGTPILRVRSLQRSIDHYERVLGFKLAWRHENVIAGVMRDRCMVMLCEGDQGHPGTWVWVGVADTEALFAEYTATGAKICMPPTNYPWALEIHVLDPDGHVLRFGSDPKDDQPHAEWVSWYRDTPDGVRAR